MARKTAGTTSATWRTRAEGATGAVAEPIDRSFLARFTLGNAALEQEVLELFAGQAPLYLRQLREAQTTKAWRNAAHTIKGSAAAVGAWRVARFAEMAEKVDIETAPAQSQGHRGQAVAGVAAAVEEARRFIARLFATAQTEADGWPRQLSLLE